MSTATSRGRRAARGVKTPTSTNLQSTTGTFRAHPRGFGFVEFTAPLTETTDETTTEHRSAFVPPPLARPLLTDDQVEVTVDLAGGRATATQVTVTQRTRTSVFGRLERRDGKVVLVPDTAVGNRVLPVHRDRSARPGTWAVLDLPTGRTTHTFDTFGPDAARAMVFTRAMLALDHTAEVEKAAADIAAAARAELSGPVPAGRADLRGVHTVTIDGPTSKDLDDAISVAVVRGGLRVSVHIADVAAFVTTGSVVDEAAYTVGTSVYLPSWNRPMLPRTLSEQALSLLPGVDRNAVTISYTVVETGHVVDAEVSLTRVTSNSQLTYESTSKHLAGGTRLPAADATVIEAAAQAAAWLGRERDARPTVRPDFQPQAHRPTVTSGDYATAQFTSVPAEPEWETQNLIERLMVAANEAVASWLTARGLPGVFRTHPAPDADLAEDLAAFVSTLPRGQRSPLRAGAPHEMVAEALSRPDARTGPTSLLLRNLDRAAYVPAAGLHYGLASHGYVHFTSPLRRYADLFVHRVIHAHLSGDTATVAELAAAAPRVSEHLTTRTGVAARIESGFLRCANTAVHAEQGRTHAGHVTEFTAKGVVVTVPATGLSGVVPFESMKGTWRPDQRRVQVSDAGNGNVLRLGTPMRVRVAEADVEGGSVTLARAPRRR